MEIIHVHGSLGPLDWQIRPTGLRSVPYDSGTNLDIIEMAAENIKIIHESIADTPEFTQARNAILNAHRVFFLGFGFHPTNMKRLEMRKIYEKGIDARGTSQGLSYQRKREINRLNPNLGLISKADVYAFLHEHVSFGELQL